MENIKKFVGFGLGLFLIFASWLAIESALLVHDSRDIVTKNKQELNSTIQNLNSASKAIEKSSLAVEQVSQAQAKLLTDKKTQDGIALLLRQGNDLAHTVTKVNVLLDKVNRETIPKVNQVLNSTDQTIAATKTVIIKLGDKTEVILDDTDKSVAQLFQLLTDPNIQRAIAGIAEAAEASGKSADSIQVTSQEIKQAIPEMIKAFQSVASNADLSSQEVTKFLTGLNKPLTKKQKVMRFLLEAIVKSSPSLLRR